MLRYSVLMIIFHRIQAKSSEEIKKVREITITYPV